jgi:hypothetical protein
MKLSLIITILILIANISFAQSVLFYIDGTRLHSWWVSWQATQSSTTNTIDNENNGLSLVRYIEGVVDLEFAYKTKMNLPLVSASHLVNVVGEWLDKHPEYWNTSGYNAAFLIHSALVEAYGNE